MKGVAQNFSEEELVTIFECARVAMADAETFDRVAEDMDMTDDDLKSLQERLYETLNRE